MKKLDEILREFPPRYASQITGSAKGSWYFLMRDGTLVGGRDFVNHYEILGIGSKDGDKCQTLKKDFCSLNRAIRMSFSEESQGRLCLEVFGFTPNEAQWSAIGTLCGRNHETLVIWDVWPERAEKGVIGEGSLSDFRRVCEEVFTEEEEGCLHDANGTKESNPRTSKRKPTIGFCD